VPKRALCETAAQCPHLPSKQPQGFSRRGILDIINVPVVGNVLPFGKPLSHQWPMFRFLDRNHEVGACQVGGRALLREAISTPRGDFQLFERVQREL